MSRSTIITAMTFMIVCLCVISAAAKGRGAERDGTSSASGHCPPEGTEEK